MKEELQKQIQPHDKDELKTTMQGILRRLQRNPKKIAKIFDHELISYASGKKMTTKVIKGTKSRKSTNHKDS
jgi:hypothetical protein